MTNIFYFRHLNEIGGIEQFFYYLAKKYQDWDITIFYKSGSAEQIKRLSQYARVEKWGGERVKCTNAFFNFNLEMLDYVDAEHYYQIAHGDYKAMGIKPNTDPRLEYIGCSLNTCETYKEVTGYELQLCYNPVSVEPVQKALHLISATRLTKEKGLWRMQRLADALDAKKVPYTWEIYTDSTEGVKSPNVIMRRSELDILPRVAAADYLVQLSDNEGYCYSVVEALCVGTAVIVTPCPVYKELGLNKRNSITLPFDMGEIPVKNIAKGPKNFTYQPPEDRWGELLAPGGTPWKHEKNTPCLAVALSGFYGIEENRMIERGETFETTVKRFKYLETKGVVKRGDQDATRGSADSV